MFWVKKNTSNIIGGKRIPCRKKVVTLFTPVTELHYQRKSGRELIWSAGEGTPSECQIAGALLGSEVIRVRAARGTSTQVEESRYQLADGGAGTLPYHSWVVAKGDEEWTN